MIATRLLWLAAAALAVGGAALQVAPPVVPSGSAAAPQPTGAAQTAPATTRRPADAARYAPVVESNIFSAGRTAPAKRYSPNAEADSTPRPPKPKKPAPPPIRVFGITKDARGGVAIVEADPKVRGPELYRLGDRLAGGTIASITDSSVIVVRPGGKVVFPLATRERRR